MPSATAPTTRACVKNIPPSFDEAKLKLHLQSAQPSLRITDCKILKTKDGRSRKIAFVGFQTASQAELAVSYFDRSFAGTTRLSVSLAFSKKRGPPSSAPEYRPWSKHSEGSSRYAKLKQQRQELQVSVGKNEKTRNGAEDDDTARENNRAKSEVIDRKRDEFLSAMGISSLSKKERNSQASKSKFWANDDAAVEPGADQTSGSDLNLNDASGASSSSESGDSSDSGSVSSDSDIEDVKCENVKGGKKSKKDEINSDLDFLKSKQVKADSLSDNESKDSDENDDSSAGIDDSSSSSSSPSDSSSTSGGEDGNGDADGGNSPSPGPSDGKKSHFNTEKSKETVSREASSSLNDRLFVRNLPFTTTEEDLLEAFSGYGQVTSVHIPIDDSKRNKGYAFITFQNNKDAKLAMDTMDGEDFQGRLIHILPARPSADQSDGIDESNLTYKEKQEIARQKEAEKSSKGWSASFLRGDAVVDNLSDRLGVSKGDVLNVKDGISSGGAAVRLALGETHIISENIAFFEDHGVDVTALESKSSKKGVGSAPKRSKTTVLVKNLPYDTSLEDLTKVFHGIGGDVPRRILLPPSKTAALVEYGHAADARRAFRRLAYKKFKHVPLYLEWAPMKAGEKQQAAQGSKDTQQQQSSGMVVKQTLADEDLSEAAGDEVSQTIYVKNLNFSTSEDQLENEFTKAGFQPRAVKIPTKAAPQKRRKASAAANSRGNSDRRHLSMGFGFVEFPSEEEALKALKALQGKLVDGHAIEMKLSTKSLSSSRAPPTDKSSKNTKIMVRNVPFEATRKELLQLFGSFGQLKRVRLPRKFDGSHRGFAFCEFLTTKEAQNAMATLSQTHLYGRHLVLEWASAEDDENLDVAKIREKAKKDAFRAGLGGSGRPGKKGKHLKF